MQTYNMQCPMAVMRLLKVGMSAIKQHDYVTTRPQEGGAAVSIAETVQHFITTMDSLKLNMVAVDQIFPLLSDLVQALNRVGGKPRNRCVRAGHWVASCGVLGGGLGVQSACQLSVSSFAPAPTLLIVSESAHKYTWWPALCILGLSIFACEACCCTAAAAGVIAL